MQIAPCALMRTAPMRTAIMHTAIITRDCSALKHLLDHLIQFTRHWGPVVVEVSAHTLRWLHGIALFSWHPFPAPFEPLCYELQPPAGLTKLVSQLTREGNWQKGLEVCSERACLQTLLKPAPFTTSATGCLASWPARVSRSKSPLSVFPALSSCLSQSMNSCMPQHQQSNISTHVMLWHLGPISGV